MKTLEKQLLSPKRSSDAVRMKLVSRRPRPAILELLYFIQTLPHVTTQHVQQFLQHQNPNSTHITLTRLVAQQLIAQRYTAKDRAHNRHATYYLTLSGLQLLKQHRPELPVRSEASVSGDEEPGINKLLRHQALADVYCYFKKHYNGSFAFFAGQSLAGENLFDEYRPDAYVRITEPGRRQRHYFIEILGRGRSSGQQAHRLRAYMHFIDSEQWQLATGEPYPSLLVVTGAANTRKRVGYQIQHLIEDMGGLNACILLGVQGNLQDEDKLIWQEVHHAEVAES
jgi:DNA-binding PadR family transcriptional regulator